MSHDAKTCIQCAHEHDMMLVEYWKECNESNANLRVKAEDEIARWKRLEQYQVDQRVILERALREIVDNCHATSGSWVNVLGDIRVIALRALGEHP